MRFDFQTVNPIYLNLDGIHVNSGCRFGVIRNLQGVCYDDLVAINADEGDYSAPIENIEVDGIFAENCHSAVRLLSVCSRVDNISISNVYGTFYCYTIGITQYFDGKGKRSNFGRLSFSNIFASEGKCAPGYHTPNGFPLISGEGQSDVEYLSISHLHRKEALKTRPTIEIPEGMHVKNLTISNCSQTNETGKEILFLNNSGEIDRLSVRDLYIPEKPVIGGKGRIHAFECDASASFLMRKPEAAEQEER